MTTKSDFRKYMHVVRFGNDEVEGIEDGEVFVFPKIDGTNASIWAHDGEVYTGSRQRVLTEESDNAGFREWVMSDDPTAASCRRFVINHEARLYGEWLVPHTFKSYRDDAWRRFWIFDVAYNLELDPESVGRSDVVEYRSYAKYSGVLEAYGLDYITPLRIVTNGTAEVFTRILDENHFLIPDDAESPGEGLVLKRYDYTNRYGRTVWAKLVRQEFKEKHNKTMGAPEISGGTLVELEIVKATVTEALVRKTMAKIQLERGVEGWRSEFIAQLLGTVYHDVVTEELWDQLKKFKNPTIDFKRFRRSLIETIREVVPEVF